MAKRKVETASFTDDAMEKAAKSPSKKQSKKLKVSSAQQKAALTEFMSVTQADKSTASKILKQHNYNSEAAINAFFSNSSSSAANISRAALTKLFDKYRDDPANAPNEINVDGVSTLLGDMSIGLDDIGSLVFSELVASPTLGKVERDGFLAGCTSAGIDSLPRLKNVVLQRRAHLTSDRTLFRNVYNHTYVLALQPGQKGVGLDMAVEFWKMLFGPEGLEWRTKNTDWIGLWLEFQEQEVKRSVNRDLWRQTLSFAAKTLEDEELGFWNEESSWPSVVDEFVEWVKERSGSAGGGEAMEE